MNKFRVNGYSYIDHRGRVHQDGSMLDLDETQPHVAKQMYKLELVDQPPVKKTDPAKVSEEEDLPKGSIKDRVAAMIKEQQGKGQ